MIPSECTHFVCYCGKCAAFLPKSPEETQAAIQKGVEGYTALHDNGPYTHIRRQVEAFHRKFAHPVLPVPMVPADRVIRKRLAFIVEEAFEAIEACVAYSNHEDQLRMLKQNTIDLIRKMSIDVDLPAFVDALGDIDYMVEGTRLECGVNGMEVANEIQRSNMSKSTEKDTYGKTIKPEGWTPPDIEGVLVKMGWVK